MVKAFWWKWKMKSEKWRVKNLLPPLKSEEWRMKSEEFAAAAKCFQFSIFKVYCLRIVNVLFTHRKCTIEHWRLKIETLTHCKWHFTMLIVQCLMFNVQSSIFNIQYSIFNVQSSIFNIQRSIFNLQSSIFNIQCSMFNVWTTHFKILHQNALIVRLLSNNLQWPVREMLSVLAVCRGRYAVGYMRIQNSHGVYYTVLAENKDVTRSCWINS